MIKAMTHAVSKIEDAFKNGGGLLSGEKTIRISSWAQRTFFARVMLRI